MLLEYLVRSKTQRAVLQALAHHEEGLTVRELAQKADAPYSNVHGEVAQMRRARLLRVKRVGNAALNTWDESNPDVKALKELLKHHSTPSTSDQDEVTAWNLKRWGAPLLRKGRRGGDLSLEETLVRGARLARRDPDVLQVWPVVVARNRVKLKLFDLELKARRQGARKTVGFLLALTGLLLESSTFCSAADRLRDRRVRKVEEFSLLPQGSRAHRLSEMRTPDVARSWCFTLNMPFEAFRSFLEKHRVET